MVEERNEKPKDPTKDFDNVEVTELEDKDLEDASGGSFLEPDNQVKNINCSC